MVTVEPEYGGETCPALEETMACNTDQCPPMSLDDLTSRANEAHEKKEAAEAAIANAEATKAAAEEVSNQLSGLDMNKFVTDMYGNLFRRHNFTYPTPANCNDLKSTLTDLINAMDYSSSEFNTARATAIVATLTSLTGSSLSPSCSSSDVADLNTAKDEAKSNGDAVVTAQANLISRKTEELNALVLEIKSLNEQISAAGGTTIDPGTTAKTVPTLARGPATPEATTEPPPEPRLEPTPEPTPEP